MVRSISREEIIWTNSPSNFPKEIKNCGMRLINNFDGHIYEYINYKWVQKEKAVREDYKDVPQLI